MGIAWPGRSEFCAERVSGDLDDCRTFYCLGGNRKVTDLHEFSSKGKGRSFLHECIEKDNGNENSVALCIYPGALTVQSLHPSFCRGIHCFSNTKSSPPHPLLNAVSVHQLAKDIQRTKEEIPEKGRSIANAGNPAKEGVRSFEPSLPFSGPDILQYQNRKSRNFY